MAGSRLEKFGTVFTRVRDLMRSGVIKESKKPLWFDVYAAFPPKKDPLYVKPSQKRWPQQKEDPVPEILYKEDEVRAKFFELYGSGSKPFDLTKPNFLSTCQRFVEKYSELESRGEMKPETLLEETGKALLAEGIVLKRRGGLTVAAEEPDPVLGFQLSDMFAEQQNDTSNKTQAPESKQSVNTDSATVSP